MGMEGGSGGPRIGGPVSSPNTMGHYSEHLAANKAAGVSHLTPNRASLANNYGVKSAGMGSSLPKPMMVSGEIGTPPEPSKGQEIGSNIY